MSTHMLTEQNHRLAKMLLEQQGELNKARARVVELEGELTSSRAEVERLKLEAARRELDDAVLAAAHEMLERLGLDPNGTELADMDDERKEGE